MCSDLSVPNSSLEFTQLNSARHMRDIQLILSINCNSVNISTVVNKEITLLHSTNIEIIREDFTKTSLGVKLFMRNKSYKIYFYNLWLLSQKIKIICLTVISINKYECKFFIIVISIITKSKNCFVWPYKFFVILMMFKNLQSYHK